MKKIAFVMVDEGVFGTISVMSKCLLSRVISNLAEGRLDGAFILSRDLKMSGAVENEYLKFLPDGERNRIRSKSEEKGYGEDFCKFLVDLQSKEVRVFIYSALFLKDVIIENLNLSLEKLRDEVGEGGCVPLMFIK